MPLHNLLTEKLISVRYENGARDNLTLPGVLGTWFDFRSREIREIAKQWHEENGVEGE